MQQLQIIGHLGQDAKIVDNSGNPFISFVVACTEKFKRQDGTEVEKTQWYNCVYRTRTNSVAAYLKKGKKIYVAGKPDLQVYQNKKTNAYAIDAQIIVNGLELLSPKDSEQPELRTVPTAEEIADDLPF